MSRLSRTISVSALLLGPLSIMAGDRFAFPPHPRLATTAVELAKLKASAPRKAQALEEAAEPLRNPVPIPRGWGDWVFYYACPDDGSHLTALNEKDHRCPRCKKVLSDERTVAAYRTLLHDRA